MPNKFSKSNFKIEQKQPNNCPTKTDGLQISLKSSAALDSNQFFVGEPQ